MPAATRATHYAIVEFIADASGSTTMVDGVVKARVTSVYAYADGRREEHARGIAIYHRHRIVNVPADTRVGSVVDTRPWG